MGIIKNTPEIVRNIYKKIEGGYTQQEIADYYDLSRGFISKIKLGMQENPPKHARWSHLYPDYLERKRNKQSLQ